MTLDPVTTLPRDSYDRSVIFQVKCYLLTWNHCHNVKNQCQALYHCRGATDEHSPMIKHYMINEWGSRKRIGIRPHIAWTKVKRLDADYNNTSFVKIGFEMAEKSAKFDADLGRPESDSTLVLNVRNVLNCSLHVRTLFGTR